MRLLIPIIYSRKGGIERVVFSLISKIATKVDSVILVLPAKEIQRYKTSLAAISPTIDTITFCSIKWPRKTGWYIFSSFLDRAASCLGRLGIHALKQPLLLKKKEISSSMRIRFLAKQHRATHCLYFLSNRLSVPKLDIPLATICHDVFWHSSPMTYPDEYIENHDKSLLEWLEEASLIFSVSQKTKLDIASIFPDFSDMIHVVPNSGERLIPSASPTREIREENLNEVLELACANTDEMKFYFPSSFGIYKDQLTLLRAAKYLVKRGFLFKIFFSGKDTDNLVHGTLDLSGQKQTNEYSDYIQQCHNLRDAEGLMFRKCLRGLGYCSETVVERLYQLSNCVVIPSKYEGFGLALAEAVSRGLPVICSDLEVFKEQIELYKCADRVLLFEAGNPDSLIDRMQTLIKEPMPRLTQDEVQRRYGHWTWDKVANQYLNLLMKANAKSKHQLNVKRFPQNRILYAPQALRVTGKS